MQGIQLQSSAASPMIIKNKSSSCWLKYELPSPVIPWFQNKRLHVLIKQCTKAVRPLIPNFSINLLYESLSFLRASTIFTCGFERYPLDKERWISSMIEVIMSCINKKWYEFVVLLLLNFLNQFLTRFVYFLKKINRNLTIFFDRKRRNFYLNSFVPNQLKKLIFNSKLNTISNKK